jgi:hypothetical protein
MTTRPAGHGAPRIGMRRGQNASTRLALDGRRRGRAPGDRPEKGHRPRGPRRSHAQVTRWPAYRRLQLERRWRGADAPAMNTPGPTSHPRPYIPLTPFGESSVVFLQRGRFPNAGRFATDRQMVESATYAGKTTTIGRHRSPPSAHPPSASGSGRAANPATSVAFRPQTTATVAAGRGKSERGRRGGA